MSHLQSEIKKYPLLPYSQLVYDTTRWLPQVYRFGNTFRIKRGAKETERWKRAIEEALGNHPVFAMGVDWRGRQHAVPREEMFHGQYHRMFFQTEGEDLLITCYMNRILGDGRSFEILMEDVLRAYKGLPLESDDYWGYLEYVAQQKQSKHYADSKAWLENEFADETVPVRPTTDRRLWTWLPPKVGVHKAAYTDLHEKIQSLATTEYLSVDGFFSLCAALAIAEYCGTDSAALTWAYEGRERPDEQRIFGSLHCDVPFQLNHISKIINQKSDLIREARNQIRSGIAHSDYPYTLTKPYTQRWNYAVNVLRIEDVEDMLRKTSLPMEVVSIPKQKYAYALLDVEIHEKAESLQLVYRYSATHYKPESIRRFAALIRKYAEWILEDNK